MEQRKEGNVLFNDALDTFYLRLYGVRHLVKDHSDSEKGNRYRHMGYSFRLAARVLLDTLSYRQDNTCHGLCYTSRGALAVTINSYEINAFFIKGSMGVEPLGNALHNLNVR